MYTLQIVHASEYLFESFPLTSALLRAHSFRHLPFFLHSDIFLQSRECTHCRLCMHLKVFCNFSPLHAGHCFLTHPSCQFPTFPCKYMWSMYVHVSCMVSIALSIVLCSFIGRTFASRGIHSRDRACICTSNDIASTVLRRFADFYTFPNVLLWDSIPDLIRIRKSFAMPMQYLSLMCLFLRSSGSVRSVWHISPNCLMQT